MKQHNDINSDIKRVKWAGPNTPYIELVNGQRIYTSKRNLLDLQHMVNDFVEFYQEDFSESRVDNRDPLEEIKTDAKYIEP